MSNINDTLSERQVTHGRFENVAAFSQETKTLMRSFTNYSDMSLTQREALDMIASKIGRILSGNHNERDHWLDIVGYAQLVVLELEKNDVQLQPRRGAAAPDPASFDASLGPSGALHRLRQLAGDQHGDGAAADQ